MYTFLHSSSFKIENIELKMKKQDLVEVNKTVITTLFQKTHHHGHLDFVLRNRRHPNHGLYFLIRFFKLKKNVGPIKVVLINHVGRVKCSFFFFFFCVKIYRRYWAKYKPFVELVKSWSYFRMPHKFSSLSLCRVMFSSFLCVVLPLFADTYRFVVWFGGCD